MRRLVSESILPSLTLDISDNDVQAAAEEDCGLDGKHRRAVGSLR